MKEYITELLDKNYKNIEPTLKKSLILKLIDLGISNQKQLKSSVNDILGLSKRISVYTKEYWRLRGWPDNLIQSKINEQRPVNVEYWIKRGHTKRCAEECVRKYQIKQVNKRKQKYNTSDWKKKSPTCVEYWIEKGESIESAKKIISNRQSTFSLAKCIKLYGEIEGRNRFDDRQRKWLKSYNDKSINEITTIHKSKDCKTVTFFKRKYCDNWDEKYRTEYKNDVINSKQDLKTYVDELINTSSKIHILSSIDNVIDIFKTRHFEYLGVNKYEFVTNRLEKNGFNFDFKHKPSIKNSGFSYISYTSCGKILRSSNEIYFYDLMHDEILDVGKSYENSRMKYDFLMKNGDYIEIAGMMNDIKYKQKMKFKEDTFGSIILCNKLEMDNYANNYR